MADIVKATVCTECSILSRVGQRPCSERSKTTFLPVSARTSRLTDVSGRVSSRGWRGVYFWAA